MRDIYTGVLRFDKLHYDGTPPGVMILQLGMGRGYAVPLLRVLSQWPAANLGSNTARTT